MTKIAVAGYGVEGKSNFAYFSQFGEVTIVDERPVEDAPEGASVISGKDAFSQLNGFDLVIRTAGLAPSKIVTDGKIWSATNEFFEKCQAPIIGVTGSKGKGTTCSFIVSILRAAGRTVHLVGNIGTPALDVLDRIKPQDIVVYELSSFQLWDMEFSPHIAVVLHIEADHLNVHGDMQEYVAAKSRIAEGQVAKDSVVYNAKNSYSKQIASTSEACKVPYQDDWYAHTDSGYFYYGEKKLCAVTQLKLPGQHNIDNVCAAISATWEYTQDVEAISKGIADFAGLDHRLQLIGEKSGVNYFDDSISTTPGSAIAAIRSFESPKILILGGSHKGGDFRELVNVIIDANIRKVLLIGQEADTIKSLLDQHHFSNYTLLGSQISMKDVVKQAEVEAQPGDVVILSPACASFDMFKSYIDRGDQFAEAVKQLV